MKRGRPAIRSTVKEKILAALANSQIHLTTSSLAKTASNELSKKVSWNTVQKYIQELVEAGKVQPLQLPHSKTPNKSGLTVYTLKK